MSPSSDSLSAFIVTNLCTISHVQILLLVYGKRQQEEVGSRWGGCIEEMCEVGEERQDRRLGVDAEVSRWMGSRAVRGQGPRNGRITGPVEGGSSWE